MSSATFNRYWQEAIKEIQLQVDYETPKEKVLIPNDRESAFQHLAILYIKYLQIFRKLETAYDQVVHPQKRRLMREAVVSIMGRLLELKHKIVELEHSDTQNYSDLLLDLKLNPEDLRVPIPKFFLEESQPELEARIKALEQFNARTLAENESLVTFDTFSIADAVRVIQMNERGRQGKNRAAYMKEVKLQAAREKNMDNDDETVDVNLAALKIQKSYRGHIARKTYRKLLDQELKFLGMRYQDPVRDLGKTDAIAKSVENRNRRKIVQKTHEEEYQSALQSTKEKIAKVEGPDMKESMQDSFRQWYMDHKRSTGKFPEFPDDEVWQQPGFKFDALNRAKSAGSKNGEGEDGEGSDSKTVASNEDAKKSKPASAKGSGKKGGKDSGKDGEEDENAYRFDSSVFLEALKSHTEKFSQNWGVKQSSEMELNFQQKHDQDIVRNEKRKEVEAELKKEVFEVLKEELSNLKSAVESSSKKGKKGKAGKGGKGGKKKGKKDKGGKGKGKKGKKEKDLTANRTMESLVEELIQAGILQKPQPIPLKEFQGDLNIISPTLSKTLITPSLGELPRVLTEYAILPLGFNPNPPKPAPAEGEAAPAEEAEETEPISVPGITSLLLYGAHGSGKTMLVNALANELGAWVFNLTPKNTAGQFQGKSSVTKMIHMVFKVAKAHAPAIIYIDNIEMVFAKKVPKDDTSDPKRIKKDILKFAKNMSSSDRVLLIANSFKPWEGDTKAMMPLFEKCIFCPKPEYGSRSILWSKFIQEMTQIHDMQYFNQVNIGVLARLSDGLTAGQIKATCMKVLTERRVKLLSRRPLTSDEFINEIFANGPISKEDDKEFKDFMEKLPLAKKRIGMLSAPEDENGGDKGKKDKKKK